MLPRMIASICSRPKQPAKKHQTGVSRVLLSKHSPLPAKDRGTRGERRTRGREGEREERGVEHFISLSSLSPSQAFNAPFSACPALCKIMLIPLPMLSHLYKPPFLPLKSNYISLRSCQKTGLACKY